MVRENVDQGGLGCGPNGRPQICGHPTGLRSSRRGGLLGRRIDCGLVGERECECEMAMDVGCAHSRGKRLESPGDVRTFFGSCSSARTRHGSLRPQCPPAAVNDRRWWSNRRGSAGKGSRLGRFLVRAALVPWASVSAFLRTLRGIFLVENCFTGLD